MHTKQKVLVGDGDKLAGAPESTSGNKKSFTCPTRADSPTLYQIMAIYIQRVRELPPPQSVANLSCQEQDEDDHMR